MSEENKTKEFCSNSVVTVGRDNAERLVIKQGSNTIVIEYDIKKFIKLLKHV